MNRSGLAVLLAAAALAAGAEAQILPDAQERAFLSRVRRVTVEGRRAGEGYWSPDGRRLVFQSEREPGNPFYQIYLVDLASGDVERISHKRGTWVWMLLFYGTAVCVGQEDS